MELDTVIQLNVIVLIHYKYIFTIRPQSYVVWDVVLKVVRPVQTTESVMLAYLHMV